MIQASNLGLHQTITIIDVDRLLACEYLRYNSLLEFFSQLDLDRHTTDVYCPVAPYVVRKSTPGPVNSLIERRS